MVSQQYEVLLLYSSKTEGCPKHIKVQEQNDAG